MSPKPQASARFRRVALFWALSFPEKVLFAKITATARKRLRHIGHEGALASIGKSGPGGAAPTDAQLALARRLGMIVNGAIGLGAGPDNCLLRSVTLSRLLEQRGIAHRVCLGAKAGEPFRMAHAWVEVAREPVNDAASNIAGYTRFEPASS